MRTLKKLFYGISLGIFLICVAILIFTMNPKWSERLADLLYGDKEQNTVEVPSPSPEVNEEEESNSVPKNTPMVYVTPAPGEKQEDGTAFEETTTYVPKTIDIKSVVPPKAQIQIYQIPVTEANEIPERLAELNGYVLITTAPKEVKKEEIDSLKEELTEGDTGDYLVFDSRFYPYYYMLNDGEKELYRQIYANAYSMNERFKPCIEIFSTNLGRVVEAVFLDNPVLFWIEYSYGCKYGPDGKVIEISLQYNETAKKPEQSIQQFEEKAEEILSVARTLRSDYEKEKYVHDQLAAQISYVADAPMNQSAYSALVNGKTVCAGYARAYQYLMQQLGIPCFYCTGYSGENHAWNIVELYGDYYNVDLTWDDIEPNNYDYFNKTDQDIADTHTRKGLSIKLPACNGKLYREETKTNKDELKDEEDENKNSYSAATDLYYEKICGRIEDMGVGKASYTDLLDADVWKELEKSYTNGNSEFREKFLVKALHKAGAQYCIINLSAKEVTENAFEVECTLEVGGY